MAKWGEGDPRWIVEERPDAVNVNNWHWTEKDATKWSEAKIKELLVGLSIESDVASVSITDVDKIEGEASVNNRKAKLIYLYDWTISLKWKGRLKGGTEKCSGKVTIPNLSDENDLSEIDFEITLKDSSSEGEIIKEYLHHHGKETIREQIGVYLKLLKEEFSKGVILPKKDGEKSSKEQRQVSNLTDGFSQKMKMLNDGNSPSKKSSSSSIDSATLTASYNFQCAAADFYNVMTNLEMVTAFIREPIVMEVKPGGKFEFFGGNISGSFIELVPNEKIVQTWRLKHWPAGHLSTVTLNIEQQESDTRVELKQTGVPASELEVIRKNWDIYYWDPIKRIYGFGCFL